LSIPARFTLLNKTIQLFGSSDNYVEIANITGMVFVCGNLQPNSGTIAFTC
jgi:hypothetical protein